MVVAVCSRRYHTVIGLRVGFEAEAADDERGRSIYYYFIDKLSDSRAPFAYTCESRLFIFGNI